VLDGPANNAMAHFLHNLLYLGGPEIHLSARPRTVRAELYRAYPIESCDTAACRVNTDTGLEILMYASHVTETAIDPRFTLEFETASVTFDAKAGGIIARNAAGLVKQYGAPDDSPQFTKLFEAIGAVYSPAPVVCGPEAAMAQTLAVNGMHESVSAPVSFPDAMVVRDDEAGRRYVPALNETLSQCYQRHLLPAEADVSWARAGLLVDLDGYDTFPRGGGGNAGGRSR
jgi:hypothetical protein